MKKINLNISGKRYAIELEDSLAEFIKEDLKEAGISDSAENSADKLLGAYLRLAKRMSSMDGEINNLIKFFDEELDS